MIGFSQLINYKMYYDSLSKDIIFLETWNENEIFYYDEFPTFKTVKKQLGYHLTDFLYLDIESIIKEIDQYIENINEADYFNLSDFFVNLMELHPYFGFYLLNFHQFMNADDFDTMDCYDILTIVRKDLQKCIYYSNEIIEPFFKKCLTSSLPYEFIYSIYIENKRINRYLKNGEILDYNFHYKTTFESVPVINEPIDIYSFYKIVFSEYMEENKDAWETEYLGIKNSFSDVEDIYEYGATIKTIEDEEDINNLVLPENLFIQDKFLTFIDKNKDDLEEKYKTFISQKEFQFVNSISVDEGNSVSVVNCIIFEFVTLLREHFKVNICQNCNRFFPSMGEYNIKYCDRVNNNLTCKVIANRNSTKDKIHNVPAINIYMKYYKRYKGRVRIMKITQEDFEEWNSLAKELRNKCLNNQITIDEFTEWLQKYDFN